MQHTKRNRIFMIFLLASFAGGACVAEDVTSKPRHTFAWKTENMHFYDAPRFREAGIKEALETRLVEKLQNRGLDFVATVEDADFALSYVAVLENYASADEKAGFLAAHKVLAEREDAPTEFEHGILYVKLADRRTGAKVWDSTVHRLVALDMPDDLREQRLGEILDELLATYY